MSRPEWQVKSLPLWLLFFVIGPLYESVEEGFLNLNIRPQFYSRMLQCNLDGIVDEEASDFVPSTGQINTFKSSITGAFKAGSYNQNGRLWRTTAGIVRIPSGCDGKIRKYVFGGFISEAILLNVNIRNVVRELFRNVVHQSLAYVQDIDADGVPNLRAIGQPCRSDAKVFQCPGRFNPDRLEPGFSGPGETFTACKRVGQGEAFVPQ